jgi:predicted AAA+ superfamily ATPase
MQRDIKNLSMIDKISILPQMLKILASRAGNLLNNSDMARCCNMNQMSFLRYRALLEAVFLIFPSAPWFRNIGKRFVKTPKIFFSDTRLLAYFLGVELDDLDKKNPTLFGQILENFVATELLKQSSLMAGHSLYHYRTHEGKEIDFLIERNDGKIIAIEVKSSASLNGSAFKAMEDLQKSIKKDFVCGVVLYCGSEIIPFGSNLFALPIQSLWELE